MVSLQSASLWKLLNQLPVLGAASSSLLGRQQSIKVSTAFVLLSVCWRGACSHQFTFPAPELLTEQGALPQTDIWSIGITAFIM